MPTHYRFALLLIFSLLLGCSGIVVPVEPKKCSSILKNDFKMIEEDVFLSIVDNDTLKFNEVKYVCVYTSFYTMKGMFDRFGKWHKAINPHRSSHPILVWENVALFPDDPKLFTVAALGLESRSTIYASVLVFDEHKTDMLQENSPYKAKLIYYFGDMIKADNSSKDKFYEIYWKMVDPSRWELMKK